MRGLIRMMIRISHLKKYMQGFLIIVVPWYDTTNIPSRGIYRQDPEPIPKKIWYPNLPLPYPGTVWYHMVWNIPYLSGQYSYLEVQKKLDIYNLYKVFIVT